VVAMSWSSHPNPIPFASTQEHAPRPAVGASHTPRACRRLAHRTRQLPFPPVTRATPLPGPRISETEIAVPPSAPVLLPASPWDPPSSPFFSLSPLLPAYPSSSVLPSNRIKGRAEPSPQIWPHRAAISHPDLDSR